MWQTKLRGGHTGLGCCKFRRKLADFTSGLNSHGMLSRLWLWVVCALGFTNFVQCQKSSGKSQPIGRVGVVAPASEGHMCSWCFPAKTILICEMKCRWRWEIIENEGCINESSMSNRTKPFPISTTCIRPDVGTFFLHNVGRACFFPAASVVLL